VAPQPLFLDSRSGRLFAVHYPAASDRSGRAVLYVPPFAEEMNRARRMATLQGRAFAASGVSTLLLDLHGTGDSAGDFRDATMARWLDDIAAAADWLNAQGHSSVGLWGLRFGALLACAAAAKQPDRFRELLLWQPVTDAKIMLTQFLRIRVAAAMADQGVTEKTEDLRAQLSAGQSVEVAGYEISSELGQALDRMKLDQLRPAPGTKLRWLEVATEASETLLPASQRVADAWSDAGVTLTRTTVAGDPFWTIQETTLAPALLAASADFAHG